MSSFTTLTLSPISLATSSTTGATRRQGPHDSAQKSTSTGVSDCSTSSSKVASVTVLGTVMTPPLGYLTLVAALPGTRPRPDQVDQVRARAVGPTGAGRSALQRRDE